MHSKRSHTPFRETQLCTVLKMYMQRNPDTKCWNECHYITQLSHTKTSSGIHYALIIGMVMLKDSRQSCITRAMSLARPLTFTKKNTILYNVDKDSQEKWPR